MPHVSIEYSDNVSAHHIIGDLVTAVHDAALATGVVPADGLRTRAVERKHYRIASGDPDYAYIAITIRVGSGRDPETRQHLLATVLDAAEAQLGAETQGGVQPSPLAIAWSAEIQEIDPAFRINRNYIRTRIQESS